MAIIHDRFDKLRRLRPGNKCQSDRQRKCAQFGPEAELRITDRMGRQDFHKDGPLLVSEGMIVIGCASRIGFPYELTNNVLTIEVPVRRDNQGRFSGFKIKLKKVDHLGVEHQ